MEIFSLLHGCGIPFDENVRISFRDHQAVFQSLEQGCSFSSVLRRQKQPAMRQLGTLLRYFSLDQAALYDARLRELRRLLKTRLAAKSVYPLFILAFASLLTWFFAEAVVPAFETLHSSDFLMLQILKGLSILFWSGAGLFCVMLKMVFILPSSKHRQALWLFRIPAVRILASLECAALLECAQKSRLSTRQSLGFMQDSRSFPFAAMMAGRWTDQIGQGMPFLECLEKDRRLDPLFLCFFRIGISGSLTDRMMEAYQKSALLILEKKIKRLSGWILASAYGMSALLALSVYQIMLTPLGILETF